MPLELTDEEYQAYLTQEIDYEKELAHKRNGYPRGITKLTDFMLVDEEVQYTVHYQTPIRRVRRITGYFSTIDHFNDSKLAELNDRRPHSMINTSGRPEQIGIEDTMCDMLTIERQLASEGYTISLDSRVS